LRAVRHPFDECRAADPRTLGTNELEKLIEVVQAQSPRPPRCVLIFLAYRHGLRAADVVDLR